MAGRSLLISKLRKNQAKVRSAVLWLEVLLPFVLYFALTTHLDWLSILSGSLIGFCFVLLMLAG
jgi:hypothetical protein